MVEYNAAKTILAPFDSVEVTFISPLSEIDTSLIRLTNKPLIINENPIKGGLKDSIQKGKTIPPSDSIEVDSIEVDSLNIKLDSEIQDSLNVDSIALAQVVDTSIIGKKTEIQDSIVGDSLLTIVDSIGLDSLGSKIDTALIDYDFTFSTHLRKLTVNSKWIEKYEYRLELLPGAITDIYGRQNDTLLLDFKTTSLDEFGNISINISELDSAQQYVVLLKLNDETIKKTIVPDTTIKRIEHKRLRVNTYSIELIKDDDGNGEWSTGDYWKKRQPEEVKTFTLDKLRENWDLEANIFWNQPNIIQKDSSGVAQDSTMLQLSPDGKLLKKETYIDTIIQKRLPSGSKNPKGRSKNAPNPKGKNVPNPRGKNVPDPKGKND